MINKVLLMEFFKDDDIMDTYDLKVEDITSIKEYE